MIISLVHLCICVFLTQCTVCMYDQSIHLFYSMSDSLQIYGDPTLMRFLIARSMDPVKAAKMFVQWQQWRAAFVPSGSISESEVPDELEPRKIYLQDLSKDGYPVMIVKACKHYPSKDQLQFKSNLLNFYYCTPFVIIDWFLIHVIERYY